MLSRSRHEHARRSIHGRSHPRAAQTSRCRGRRAPLRSAGPAAGRRGFRCLWSHSSRPAVCGRLGRRHSRQIGTSDTERSTALWVQQRTGRHSLAPAHRRRCSGWSNVRMSLQAEGRRSSTFRRCHSWQSTGGRRIGCGRTDSCAVSAAWRPRKQGTGSLKATPRANRRP